MSRTDPLCRGSLCIGAVQSDPGYLHPQKRMQGQAQELSGRLLGLSPLLSPIAVGCAGSLLCQEGQEIICGPAPPTFP